MTAKLVHVNDHGHVLTPDRMLPAPAAPCVCDSVTEKK